MKSDIAIYTKLKEIVPILHFFAYDNYKLLETEGKTSMKQLPEGIGKQLRPG